PGYLEGWEGGVNVGFGLTAGNSDTKNLALAFTGTRPGLYQQLSLYAGSVYAPNVVAPAATRVPANTNKGGARFDHDIKPRLFVFVNAYFCFDALQDLKLRSVFGGGLCFHAIKTANTTLDFLGGIAYTRENYTQL